MSDFKKLKVWQKAHALALSTTRVGGKIRGAPHLSLKSQLIRSAMSIPANIVEGRAQSSELEFARYLKIAIASASELESHLIMAFDLGAIPSTDYKALMESLTEVRMMMHGLIRKLGK